MNTNETKKGEKILKKENGRGWKVEGKERGKEGEEAEGRGEERKEGQAQTNSERQAPKYDR